MNTASLELCEELYELSGWLKTDYWYHKYSVDSGWNMSHWRESINFDSEKTLPAYDSAYLLAKLDGVKHDISIPADRLLDSANYLAELHIRRFKAEWRKVDGLPYEASNLGKISQKDGLYCIKHQLNHGRKYESCNVS